MYARAVDEAGTKLTYLHRQQAEELGAALVAFVLAAAATQVFPALALPLLAGGLVVGARGLRTAWLRWDLVDRLAGNRDAYALAEVNAYATRQATMTKRRSYAAEIRSTLAEAVPATDTVTADELEALATDLEDARLSLDPACAVGCKRLIEESDANLLDHWQSPNGLKWYIHGIRTGFTPLDPSGRVAGRRRAPEPRRVAATELS